MHHATRTTTRLLEGLFDPANHEIWREFDRRYRPIIIGLSRKLGLRDDEAADVAQETLTRFLRAYRANEYDRARGRLRSWIIGIARYRIADAKRARAAQQGWRGDSIIDALPEEQELDALWDAERRRAILRQALHELRANSRTSERTITAFELMAFHQRAPAAVAEELAMSMDDVYQAKNRVATSLRSIVARIENLYDED